MKMGSKKVVCFEMMRWPASAGAWFGKAAMHMHKLHENARNCRRFVAL